MTKKEIIDELAKYGVTADETATNSVLLAQLKEAKEHTATATPSTEKTAVDLAAKHDEAENKVEKIDLSKQDTAPKNEMVQISKEEWNQMQETIKMLAAVADKGRVQHYEQQRQGKRILKAKLSVIDGKYIVGWRVEKDISIFHPTTGKQIGEEQVIELNLLDKDTKIEKKTINGYKQFSDIRYNERVECDIVSKKENWDETWTYDLKLPDGRVVSLDSRFVN